MLLGAGLSGEMRAHILAGSLGRRNNHSADWGVLGLSARSCASAVDINTAAQVGGLSAMRMLGAMVLGDLQAPA